MLYNDFVKAGVALGELRSIEEYAQKNGLELAESHGTFALVDEHNSIVAEGLENISCWLLERNIFILGKPTAQAV